MALRRARPNADLIGDLYESAVDDALWPQFARLLANAAGAPTSAVWVFDSANVRDLSVTSDGLETDLPYRQHFWKLDPWQRSVFKSPLERVLLGAELFPEGDLIKTEFYNDFAKKFGLLRRITATMQLRVFANVIIKLPRSRSAFYISRGSDARPGRQNRYVASEVVPLL